MQALLETHIASTYIHLRRGMAALALALAPVLWIGGAVVFDLPLQTSMSAYYYTAMRDVFVGALCALGAFLFLYKGYTPRENWALNIAGICGPLLALFPTRVAGDCAPAGGGFSWHALFAVVFFAAISYACIFLQRDGPNTGLPPERLARYRRISQICGGVMIFCVAAALAYTFLLPADLRAAWCNLCVVFWLEAAAVSAFSVHWIMKSFEYDHAFSWLPWRFVRQVG
jgi:hypothetical protein